MGTFGQALGQELWRSAGRVRSLGWGHTPASQAVLNTLQLVQPPQAGCSHQVGGPLEAKPTFRCVYDCRHTAEWLPSHLHRQRTCAAPVASVAGHGKQQTSIPAPKLRSSLASMIKRAAAPLSCRCSSCRRIARACCSPSRSLMAANGCRWMPLEIGQNTQDSRQAGMSAVVVADSEAAAAGCGGGCRRSIITRGLPIGANASRKPRSTVRRARLVTEPRSVGRTPPPGHPSSGRLAAAEISKCLHC